MQYHIVWVIIIKALFFFTFAIIYNATDISIYTWLAILLNIKL